VPGRIGDIFDALLGFIGSSRFIALLFVLFFWGGGAALFVSRAILQTFVPTPASVVRAWPLKTVSHGRGRWAMTTVSYSPRVRLAYEFKGQQYESVDMNYDVQSVTEEGVKEIIRRDYQPGAALTAYVNPARPSEALIRRTIPPVVFGIALVLGAVSAGFLVRFWRARK
jgi:hypothetical protein